MKPIDKIRIVVMLSIPTLITLTIVLIAAFNGS